MRSANLDKWPILFGHEQMISNHSWIGKIHSLAIKHKEKSTLETQVGIFNHVHI